MNKNMDIKVLKLSKIKTLEIKKNWEKCFIPTGTDRKKLYLDNMLWHIFSYNVQECQEGEEAINNFKDISKDTLYIFLQCSDISYLIENAKTFIFEASFLKWCFIYTFISLLGTLVGDLELVKIKEITNRKI